jgi:YihY family inner membrane protein
MNAILTRLDRFQRRHRSTAFGYGVVKKYGEDRGGYLAALIAYYGFLSLFPLLLLFYTVSSYILPHYPGAQKALTDSVLGEFPVIGPQLRENAGHPLHGSSLALVFGVLGLAWGALGVSQVLQETMYQVWDVPRKIRPNFLTRILKGLLLFALLGVGVAATTVVASLGSVLNWGPFGSVLAAIPAAVVNIAVFYGMFRILSPPHIKGRQLLPGSVMAGIGWQVLQTVGVNLVSHQLRHASQVYGVFGFTLALLSFLYLAGQLTAYSAELNVVKARHLWPRSMLADAADSEAAPPHQQPRPPLPPRPHWSSEPDDRGEADDSDGESRRKLVSLISIRRPDPEHAIP